MDYLNKRNNCKRLIEDYLVSRRGNTEFYDILEYTLGDTGKLIRPTITAIVESCLDLKLKALDQFKIALEMTHVASLIHDDLPGLDNDNERRGKPSTHIKYSEGIAILSGDYLYAESLGLLRDSDLISVHDSQALISLLIDSQRKLNEGQILELNLRLEYKEAENAKTKASKDSLISQIEKISLLKTGALFTAAGVAPLLLSNSKSTYSEMKEVLELFSLCFQLKDDLLDSKHDKDVDKEFNHINILGHDAAVAYYNFLFQNTISKLSSLGPKFENLKAFFEITLKLE